MIEISLAANSKDLIDIKNLQSENLKSILNLEDQTNFGFVTASYSLAFLEIMHKHSPAIIAKDQNKLVGYALATTKAVYGHHDLLDDLFNNVDQKIFKDYTLKDTPYILVGQLCVAKTHRGLGVSQKIYEGFKDFYKNNHRFLITDVDNQNLPSLNAHKKIGFEIIDELTYGGSSWSIVLWDWHK